MSAQRMAGVPIRLIVLKSRKVGVSTLVEAEGYRLCDVKPNTRALICAQTTDDSGTLFEMTRLFHEQHPHPKKLEQPKPGMKEIRWAPPHRSRFQVQTAGRIGLKRGDTLSYVHCSELPQWPDPKGTLLSVLNALPSSGDYAVVIESTAQGYDHFKKLWDDAVQAVQANPNSVDLWIPIFFSWLEHPEYRKDVPPAYVWGDLDEWELELKGLGATPEQLYWRRCVLAEKCGGDPELFAQEYPHTPESAFRASGRRAIPHTITTHHRMSCKPGKKVRLEYDHQGKVIASGGDRPTGYWEVWEFPEPDRDYTLGGDVSEGLLSDPNDPRSGPDRTTGFVLERRDLEQVARWVGQATETDFGREMLKCAKWYNDAWSSPEANNTGKASVLVFAEAGYPRLYRRRAEPGSVDAFQEKGQWGWRTTTSNRDVMIADWIDWSRKRDAGWEGRLIIHSSDLVDEEETFIVTKDGRREHSPGKHDDELFAGMIALQLHLCCPRTREPVFQEPERQHPPGEKDRAIPWWGIPGAMDPGPKNWKPK